jgi:hypothetical protein
LEHRNSLAHKQPSTQTAQHRNGLTPWELFPERMAGIAAVNILIIITARIFIPCGPAATVAMRVTSGNFGSDHASLPPGEICWFCFCALPVPLLRGVSEFRRLVHCYVRKIASLFLIHTLSLALPKGRDILLSQLCSITVFQVNSCISTPRRPSCIHHELEYGYRGDRRTP